MLVLAGTLFLAAGCGGDGGGGGPGPGPLHGDPPRVTGFSPLEASPGDSITVLGSAFVVEGETTFVAVGGGSTVPNNASTTEIRMVLPPGATTAPVHVTTMAGTGASSMYLVVFTGELPGTTIASVTPAGGPVGTVVTIEGSGFADVPLANHVTFNGVLAEVTEAAPTSLTTIVPDEATPGPLTVATSRGRVTTTDDFLVETGGGEDCGSPTVVTGAITLPLRWTLAGCPYIIRGTVTVGPAARLDIDAGVVVKFDGPGAMMVVQGQLVTAGTHVNRVVFTSFRDDAHTGDTNGDGTATMPAPGDWSGVRFDAGSRADLVATDFLYSGLSGEGSVRLDARAAVSDCEFAFNTGYGLTAPVAPAAPESIRVTNSSFYVNDRPLLVNPGVTLGTTNAFASGSDTNTENAIFLTRGPSGPGAVTWDETEVPFAMIEENGNDNVFLGTSTTLTIGPGAVVKLFGSAMDFVINGTLMASGDPGGEIVFTSFRDDAIGGDTNGDGGATSPARGDWNSVEFGNRASATLRHTRFRYGGGATGRPTQGELVMKGGSTADLRECEIALSNQNGVSLFGGEGTIAGCLIRDNRNYGIYAGSGEIWYRWGGERLDAPYNQFSGNQLGDVFIYVPTP